MNWLRILLTRPLGGRLVAGLFLLAFGSSQFAAPPVAIAQDADWCAPDGLDEFGQPHPPRPYWGQLDDIPDYVDVMNNFNIAKSITLLISSLEKSLALLTEVTTDYGPDTDGFCLCNCTQDAGWWVNYIKTTLKTNLEAAVIAAKDDYVDGLTAKLVALKNVVLDTLPAFKADVKTAIQDACNLAAGTECDLNNPLDTVGDVADDLADIALAEVESIFDAEKEQALELLTGTGSPYALGMEQIEAQLDEVVATLPDILKFKFKKLGQELGELMDITGQVIGDVLDGAKAIAQTYTTGDLVAWKNQIIAAVQAEIAIRFADSGAAWTQLQVDVEAAVQARIDAIKDAIDDVYVTATSYQGPFNTFKNTLTTGIIADLTNVGGCYGTAKRSECTIDVGGFCEGTAAGTIGGSGGIDVPVWFPTEVFKDGKTALLFALKHLGFLEKVNDFLQSAAPSWMGSIGTWIDGLKNALDVLDKIAWYVNTFTDGFHLGGYSDMRPDLHMCVGYAGHGAFAELFSFNVGDHTVAGGSSYSSHNLTKNHRAQFRSGGFAVSIDGKTLQLAPGISFNTQMDGWRMWDKKYPFGLGRNADGGFWNNLNPGNWSFNTNSVGDVDIFNLVDQSQLEALCPGGVGPCNLTVANFIYNGYFPIDYTASSNTYEWPRTGIDWELEHSPIAVFGAGLNLDFQMKTYRWDITPSILLFAPPPVFLTPWLSLDAGAGWKYEANFLRGTLQEKLNANLPASDQLTADDFRRDKFPASSATFNGEPFQAPDVTEDMGTSAYVEPRVGADLDIGIKIAKFLKIGITATISVGLNVEVGGFGGILDLNRALVDALANSNPPGDDCHAVIEDNVEKFCSNELHKPDEPRKDDPDCIDMSPGSSNKGPYSKQTYACDGNSDEKACKDYGYCLRKDGVVMAHDVVQDVCEGKPGEGGHCEAVYIENPCQCGELCEATLQQLGFGPPSGFCDTPEGMAHLQSQLDSVQGEANGFTDPEQCGSWGWCYHWGPIPGTADGGQYHAVLTGMSQGPDGCPPGVDEFGKPIVDAAGVPIPAQWVPFKWVEGQGDPGMGGTWYPYQCSVRTTPVVTGWTGPDCNPIEFGYPSACSCWDNANCAGTCEEGTCSEAPATGCACNPDGGATCPAGRVCDGGACVKECTTDTDCGPSLVCSSSGGCLMENGVPFAEQIIWQMRTVEEPMHVVASYALNKLVVSAVLGLGVSIGARYKIFRKWREKTLWSWSKSFPLLEMPFVKHQLGLEAQYQDDCPDSVGVMTNHQPVRVTRPSSLTNGTPSEDLIAWCKPSMSNNVVNPPSPDDPGDVIGQGLEDTHNWGYDLGLEFWYSHQMCIDGVPWYEYFAALHEDPQAVWGLLDCTYYAGDGVHDLDCDGPQEMLGSLITALGCLDVDGLMQNALLSQLLLGDGLSAYVYNYTPMHNGSPSGPTRQVLDWTALFYDMEELLQVSNVVPTVVGYNGQSPIGPFGPKFFLTFWLAQLDQCIADIEDGGKYVDSNLIMEIGIGEEDFGPCADPCDEANPDPDLCPKLGACCTPTGGCTYVSATTCQQFGGAWQANKPCDGTPCKPNPSAGACCIAGGCVPVPSAEACGAQNGSFQPGVSCADIFDCQGVSACCAANGCAEVSAAACNKMAGGTYYAGQSCSDVGQCLEPVGACCKPDGACASLTATACSAVGGAFGAGGSCGEPGFCTDVLTGACCLPSGCSPLTAAGCLAQIAKQGGGQFTPGATCTQVGCDLFGCCHPSGECLSLPELVCIDFGGVPTANCVAGQACFPNDQAHACCLPSGDCTDLTVGQCAAVGGSASMGELCSTTMACVGQPHGACCLPSGQCADLSVLQCEIAGGTGFQQGVGCPDTQLQCGPANEACCLPTGQCTELPADQCNALGGSAKPGHTCDEAGLCVDLDPVSACCLTAGCQMLPVSECHALQGVAHPGKKCNQVLCKVQITTGACCTGTSCRKMTNIQCAERGGIFHAGVACNQISCFQLLGACCLGDSCLFTNSHTCKKKQAALGVVGGFYPGMTCGQVPCGTLGACCHPSGECVQTFESKCVDAGGSFSAGQSCDSVECCEPPPLGACCVDKQCYELPETHCGALGGIWQPDQTCEQAACCGQLPATVACCLANGCFDLTAAACSAMGGSAGGPGTACKGLSPKGCLIALPATGAELAEPISGPVGGNTGTATDSATKDDAGISKDTSTAAEKNATSEKSTK